MTGSYLLSPGRKDRSAIEHCNAQVSKFLASWPLILLPRKLSSQTDTHFVDRYNIKTVLKSFWMSYSHPRPPLRSPTLFSSCMLEISPYGNHAGFLFCLPPISACGHLDRQNILVYHSLKLQLPQ